LEPDEQVKSSIWTSGPICAPPPITAKPVVLKEEAMQKALKTATLAVVLAATSITGGPANAQTPPGRQDLPPVRERQELPTQKLNLTLEQRHTIRELIKDVKDQASTHDVKAVVGEPIPSDITPSPMPAAVGQKVPQVKAHRFFVAGQKIVIVDPKDNNVAEVINLSEN